MRNVKTITRPEYLTTGAYVRRDEHGEVGERCAISHIYHQITGEEVPEGGMLGSRSHLLDKALGCTPEDRQAAEEANDATWTMPERIRAFDAFVAKLPGVRMVESKA